LTQPACVIVKHANPCGVALGANSTEAYQRAFQTDSTSAFGGIIAFNNPVDASTVEALNQQFVEVLLAPDYSPEALQMLAQKKNMRVLRLRSEEHTSELQSRFDLVCRLLLEKNKD